MSTVLSVERHPVHPASVDAFETLLDEMLAEMRHRPGSLWADAARALDDDPSYLVVSEWRTQADLDAWETSGEASAYRDRGEALVRATPTRRRFVDG